MGHDGACVELLVEQSKRFIDIAREVGADDDPEALDRAFGGFVKLRGQILKTDKPLFLGR